MNNEAFSIGSVVKCKDILFLVIGINYEKTDNKYYKMLMVVPYPYGCLDRDSIRLVKADEVVLVELGHSRNNSVFDKYYVNMMDTIIEHNETSEVDRILESTQKRVLEGMKHG